MLKKKKVHFMGIGGSGMAGVALLAKAAGFEVSGCDLSPSSYYTEALIKQGIKPKIGHSADHLKDIDILTVSPAIFDINPNHPELVEARKKGILMTWQKFMGKYLQKDKLVIAIAGTHGKSTTTALTGLVLENAGLDPTVEVGAMVPSWGATVRSGQSKYFVCEADEFGNNFLNYSPSIAIINNIEMDHPEFFQNFNQFLGAFEKFVKNLTGRKYLIVNEDSPGIEELIQRMDKYIIQNEIRLIGYRIKNGQSFPFEKRYLGKIINLDQDFSEFLVSADGFKEKFQLKIPGIHNIYNSLGVIALSRILGIDTGKVRQTLSVFTGISRRLEMVGKEKGVSVFDDYGHHPTAIKATIGAARQKYPGVRIWAIFEPHQFSRVRLFVKEFNKALALADKIIVTKIFVGREKPQKGIDGSLLLKNIDSQKAWYIEDFDKVAQKIALGVKPGDVVIVFGAGKSYLISEKILQELKK